MSEEEEMSEEDQEAQAEAMAQAAADMAAMVASISIPLFSAARMGDPHVCPMVTGVVPHVGGPILKGAATVKIGKMAAARVMDQATCTGPPDMISKGSATVKIEKMMAARLLDMTAHGGMIVFGCPTVSIGG